MGAPLAEPGLRVRTARTRPGAGLREAATSLSLATMADRVTLGVPARVGRMVHAARRAPVRLQPVEEHGDVQSFLFAASAESQLMVDDPPR